MARCLISKAELGRLLQVSQPTVTNWCKREQLYGPALIGSGRARLIDLDVALAQLKEMDPGQSLGHGRARDDAVDRLIELRNGGWQPGDPEPADELFPPVLHQFEGNPVAVGAAAMAFGMINRIGAAMAAVSMAAGAKIEVAYALENLATIAACTLVEEAADEIGGFDLRDQPLIDLDNMFKADWVGLAKRYGVKFDKKACDAYAARVCSASDPQHVA